MKEFLLSLLSVSVAGTLIAAVFPDGEMKKPLMFLCGAVVASVFLTLVISAMNWLTSGKTPDFPDYPDYDFSEVFNQTVSDSVSASLSAEMDSVMEKEFSCRAETSASVSYENGDFSVGSIDAFVSDCPENAAEIIRSRTGLDVMIYGGNE